MVENWNIYFIKTTNVLKDKIDSATISIWEPHK